jgi:hypothetical protein
MHVAPGFTASLAQARPIKGSRTQDQHLHNRGHAPPAMASSLTGGLINCDLRPSIASAGRRSKRLCFMSAHDWTHGNPATFHDSHIDTRKVPQRC